ncbi:MAG: hypothetical protein IJG51_11825 [Synergistaceae bacterium]|nr:hypothetical protein [Synergistaceae bacterium]MBQ6665883.1 hypothetical protein [Synergistaceae bacterium]
MPTFRNDGDRAIIYSEPNGKDIIIFDPGKNVQLVHWVPYQRLGLTLVSESYPPVPNTVLISGDFNFTAGMERRFEIEPCQMYTLDIYLVEGSVSVYLGSASTGKVISLVDYHEKIEWKNAPYLRVVGGASGAKVSIQATLKE